MRFFRQVKKAMEKAGRYLDNVICVVKELKDKEERLENVIKSLFAIKEGESKISIDPKGL